MAIPKPLEPQQLFHQCDLSQFDFQSTAELGVSGDIIGQPRAIEAIRFGFGIQQEGFNLFALGPNGVGKHTLVNRFLEARAQEEARPDDWCYVYNFEKPHQPQALNLPAGQGSNLVQDMEQLVQELFSVLSAMLNSDEYASQRNAIVSEQRSREMQAFKELEEKARAENIKVVSTPDGFAMAPLQEGEVMSPEAYEDLPAEDQRLIQNKIMELQGMLQQILRQLPQWHRETQKKLNKLQEETAAFVINPLFEELRQKYHDLPHVLAYLDAVKEDIVANVGLFLEPEEGQDGPDKMISLSRSQSRIGTRYQVNLMIDHSKTEGAPVVFEDLPNYQNLIGRVEHVSHMGTLVTDFTLIKAGALHRANGGYLILDALKLLQQPYAWDGLKRALRSQKIHIESLGQLFGWVSTVSLEPQPIPLQIKVILTGERLLYYLLNQHDRDFRELFKVAADFENEMDWDEANSLAYARLIADLAQKENLRHCDQTAVARVIEHSARIAGDAYKLTTHMQSISDLLREADYWAQQAGHEIMTREDIQKALEAQIYRSSRIRDRIQETILRETIMIDTQGAAVGQINGLSVIMLDNYTFGRPSRITARYRLGKGEVVDIERQVEMGGPIHSKGVLILAGFLGARYAQKRPLTLSATLVFEQSYGGVDGDSASSAELYALMSALSNVPLKQSLAVTGSVNQHGQVQAIGGANEKIEGFFDLCQARGLTGEQGVLIPQANVKHLMLRQDVVGAVAAGQFHIYALQTVDQGIELLSGLPAGEADEEGHYPPESINGRIVACLESLAQEARAYSAPPAEKSQGAKEA